MLKLLVAILLGLGLSAGGQSHAHAAKLSQQASQVAKGDGIGSEPTNAATQPTRAEKLALEDRGKPKKDEYDLEEDIANLLKELGETQNLSDDDVDGLIILYEWRGELDNLFEQSLKDSETINSVVKRAGPLNDRLARLLQEALAAAAKCQDGNCTRTGQCDTLQQTRLTILQIQSQLRHLMPPLLIRLIRNTEFIKIQKFRIKLAGFAPKDTRVLLDLATGIESSIPQALDFTVKSLDFCIKENKCEPIKSNFSVKTEDDFAQEETTETEDGTVLKKTSIDNDAALVGLFDEVARLTDKLEKSVGELKVLSKNDKKACPPNDAALLQNPNKVPYDHDIFLKNLSLTFATDSTTHCEFRDANPTPGIAIPFFLTPEGKRLLVPTSVPATRCEGSEGQSQICGAGDEVSGSPSAGLAIPAIETNAQSSSIEDVGDGRFIVRDKEQSPAFEDNEEDRSLAFASGEERGDCRRRAVADVFNGRLTNTDQDRKEFEKARKYCPKKGQSSLYTEAVQTCEKLKKKLDLFNREAIASRPESTLSLQEFKALGEEIRALLRKCSAPESELFAFRIFEDSTRLPEFLPPPRKQPEKPADEPTVEVHVKASTAAMRRGESAGDEIAGQTVKLFPDSVLNVSLPGIGRSKPQDDHDKDPIQGTTDNNGEVVLQYPAKRPQDTIGKNNDSDGTKPKFGGYQLAIDVTNEDSRNVLIRSSQNIGQLPDSLKKHKTDEVKIGDKIMITFTFPKEEADTIDEALKTVFLDPSVRSQNPGSLAGKDKGPQDSSKVKIEVNLCRTKEPLAPRPNGSFKIPPPESELRGAKINFSPINWGEAR